jgi:hypothetical protein
LPTSPDPDALTVIEAAELLKIPPPAVVRLIDSGRLGGLSRDQVVAWRDDLARTRREALARLAAISEEHGF